MGDHGFRPNGLQKVDSHKADTDPPDRWRLRMPVSTFGWLFERRRAVQIYLAGINSTIPLITQRKYSQIQLATKKESRIIPGNTGRTFLHRPRFKASEQSDGTPGAGKEAECRYINPARKRSYSDISAISVDTHSRLFSLRSSGSRARPDGLDRRERPSGALESASAVSRARARKGDVSRPERSGGRVTTTDEKNERPGPPVSDEGGVRRLSGAPYSCLSGRAERPKDAKPSVKKPEDRQSERSDACRDRAK